jgi:non-ribosomal peptide synthetase component F
MAILNKKECFIMSKIQPSTNTEREIGFELIFQRLSEHAIKQPNKPAIYAGDNFITYSQLLERVNNHSFHLTNLAIESGAIIGIAMERSINMVIAMLSIWRSGCAFVPLDVDFPQFRLNQVIEDAKPSLILCDIEHRHKVNSQNINTSICEQT